VYAAWVRRFSRRHHGWQSIRARPERGNGITLAMPRELAPAVELADRVGSVPVLTLPNRVVPLTKPPQAATR
jgi:hypothetical protein